MKNLLLICLAFVSLSSCSTDNDVTTLTNNTSKEALIADFKFESAVVSEDSSLNIENLSKGYTNYVWDFGNQNIYTNTTPDFKFLAHGFYNVTLTVRNNLNEEASVTKEIEVLCNFGGGIHTVDNSDI